MKNKSLTETRTKEVANLEKEAYDMRLKIAKAKSEMKVAKEKDLKKVKNLKRDLAQVLTIIKEKELATKSERKEEEKKGN